MNYGYLSKNNSELWTLFWENVVKIAKKSKGYAKVLMISLRFEETSLHCRNISIHHQISGIVSSTFSNKGKIMGHRFNQNNTSLSKTWPSLPSKLL